MRVREKIKAWRGEVLLGSLWILKGLCKPLGLCNFYRSLVIRLIKRQGIFDRAYYLETNADVAQAGMLPLRHYVSHGDRENRPPMPLFDPAYYRSQVRGRIKHVNALLHYAYVGRYRCISPSLWFDVDYYLANNKDIARSNLDPLVHYLKWGGFEGRFPCPQFDSAYYLNSNAEVAEARLNPLIHYLFYGRLQGKPTQPEHPGQHSADSPISPDFNIQTEKNWLHLKPRANAGYAEVDVVVPVFKARIETLRCLYSVLNAQCELPFELIVINDGSPDQKLVEELRQLARAGLFTLRSNSKNRGFIQTVNRGMRLHGDRDIVLLNSDTEVYDGWLDRLYSAAYRNAYTGTVTPLSNNATICSYPRFLQDNPFPLELGYRELDGLVARVNAGKTVEAPTGVGFCLFIKRACLQDTGWFDDVFGKGYGEENDFCQKAIQKGWRNMIAADIFVRHFGAASFQGEKEKRVQSALKIMDKRYPHYKKHIDDFIRRDPLKEARICLDSARMQRMRRDRNVLIVSHNRGGGSERHVQEDIHRLTHENYGVFVLRPMAGRPSHAILSHSAIKSLPNINPFALADTAVLAAALKELNITEVHSHSLVDFVPEMPTYLINVIKALGAYSEVNLHDYKVICPRLNLADENGLYCGEPAEAECNRCLLERGSDFQVFDIQAWRSKHKQALLTADKVLVPDQDMAERLPYYFPEVYFEVSPHEDIALESVRVQIPLLQPQEKLRVVVIGAISKLKGFHVLISCARNAQQYNLPIEFIVMGYGMNDKLMEEAGIYVMGKYQEHEALEKLNNLNPHVVWLPSLWPETYSYTLSLALKASLPVFAFDIGAIAHRLKRAGMGEMLMDLSLVDAPSAINNHFQKFRDSCLQLVNKK